MGNLKSTYDPTLSVEENATINGCSVANVRKFIQNNGIDRRFDKALKMWERVNEFANAHQDYSVAKSAKELGISPNTFIKYCGAEKPTQTDPTKVSKFDLSKYCNVIKSVGTNDECLHGIFKLYTPKGIEVDLTYNIGGIYTSSGLPHPTLKFDKYPQTKDTIPLDNIYQVDKWHTCKSVLFDLPFFYGKSKYNSYLKMVQRYTSFETEEELISTNIRMMFLSAQLLRPNGVLIVKTQNIKTTGHQTWISDILSNVAEEVGLEKIDEFIFLNRSRLGIAATANTQHAARKAHGYYLVFRRVMPKELVKVLIEDGVLN